VRKRILDILCASARSDVTGGLTSPARLPTNFAGTACIVDSAKSKKSLPSAQLLAETYM
jgi:hypothetical protein